MDTIYQSTGRYLRHIKNQIPDLAVENICRPKPQSMITINQCESTEMRRGFEYGKTVWISDYLSVVVVNER